MLPKDMASYLAIKTHAFAVPKSTGHPPGPAAIGTDTAPAK